MNGIHHPHLSRYPEKLISIEYSEEDDDYVVDNYKELEYNQSESDRQLEIKKLKKQSISRLHNKWNEILERYSKIDDSKESDEIDIITGDIITDNGHLRSLGSNSQDKHRRNNTISNIWSENFDWENDNLNEKRKESRLRKKKRELRAKLKEQDLFHVSSTVKSEPEEVINRRVCDDNMLLLTPSPVKRARLEKSMMNGKLAPPPPKLFQRELMPNLTKDSLTNGTSKTSPPLQSTTELIDSDSDSEDGDGTESTSAEADSSFDFDDEYLIITSPFQPKSSRSIYNCAFESCHYCTGNHSLYQSHLLERHPADLRAMGYPINIDITAQLTKVPYQRPNDNLLRDFPLVLELPPLPQTSNAEPIVCGRTLRNGLKCKKFFVSHIQPHKCSHKRQVLICPLLGCGFMTDEGYLCWRNHFITAGHCKTHMGSIPYSKDHPQRRDDGYDSIEELFSD